MYQPQLALSGVSTANLKKALQALHRGEFDVPVSPVGLARIGLQDASDPFLHTLRDVNAAGVRAVLVAVLAERIAAENR